MESAKSPTPIPNPVDIRNDDKENKLHSLKEVPKRGFIQIKESFKTLKNINRQPVVDKAEKGGAIRFMGDGVSFKAKLIGILEVSEARGDRMCQEALFDLKMAIRAAGEHKQRITINVAIDGLKLRDEKTGDCLYHHPIHKISFIAQDMVDTRAFGYIFGSPDTGHRFFGIKTDKAASQVVITMRDLFQTVFELKKQEIEMTRQQRIMDVSGLYLEALATTATKTDHTGINDDGSKRFNRDLSNLDKSDFKNSTPNANDLLSLELELNNLQQGLSQMESITPPSADPFGDSFTAIPTVALTKLPPPPNSGERRTRNSSVTSSGQQEKHWFDKETESIFGLSNPSEVSQSLQQSDFKVIESTNRTSPTIKSSDAFDVFTELDPLGTGRSKPYVDKKDFFQELKNPPKKILNQLAAHENEKISENQTQNLSTKSVNNSFSSDLPFKETSGFVEDPFKTDNFIKSNDSNSVDIEFADFSSFESLKPVSPQLQHKSPLIKSDSSSSQNSAQGLLKASLPPDSQKPYNIATSPKYNLMTKNKSKLKIRKTPSPDYYRNEDPVSPDDDYAIMKLMTLPQRIDIAPEPPPRPSSSLEPPPLPPKKQQIPSKSVKPIRTRNSHYDYIENYVSSYNLPSTQQESEAPPLPLPSRKPKSDNNKKKEEELDSEDYLLPVTSKKTASESKSNASEIESELSIMSNLGILEYAKKLNVSLTTLSKMTVQELSLRLAKLNTNSIEDTQSFPIKSEEEKKKSEEYLYDKYAVFREYVDKETNNGVTVTENDKYAALRDIPIKEPKDEEESMKDQEEILESNQSNDISDQVEVELNHDQVFNLQDEKIINEQVIETKNVKDNNDDDEENEEVEYENEDDNHGNENSSIKIEESKESIQSEVLKEVTTVTEKPEQIESNSSQKLFDNSQCWATFDAEPDAAKKVNSPWSVVDHQIPIQKSNVNLKKGSSSRSKCSSSWDDCEESEDNLDTAKRSLESSIEDFPRAENGWSDGESMYEDEPYYERNPKRRSNRKISPRHREPSPWEECNRYSDEWESPYMFASHWRVPHMDDERRRLSKDDKRRIYVRPDIDRRAQKLPSASNWDEDKYQMRMYERRRRYLEEQYNWDRYGPPIPKGFKTYPRPPPLDNSDEEVKMRYRLPKKNRYGSATTPRKHRRPYHRRSDGSDEERSIPPRKPYSQEELEFSESELEQNWSRRSKSKWSLKRNQTSPFDDNFTPDSPDSSVFTKTMSTCSDLGYLTKPSPSISSKTNKNMRRPKRSDSGHRSVDSNSKTEVTKHSPFEDNFTPDNATKDSVSSEFSFKDDDGFTAKEVKIPQDEVSNSPKEMKKSESINIFSRNTDPFEDDDFFTQDVSSKPNLASLEEAISDREGEGWDKRPDRTKNE